MATVLIVEDEPQVLILSQSILQHAGHETVTAATVAQAQAIIHSDQKLDLIFTDVQLQDQLEGGLQIGQMAHTSRPNVPVLYTSGGGMTDGMKQLFVVRSAFLPKPYTDDLLIGAVASLLGHQ